MLLRAALERQPECGANFCRILEFSSGEGILNWVEKHPGELTLIFLDIEMPGIDGMETAHKLRALSRELQLVFVTGYSDYVYDGYTVGALGYLLKPPKPEQLTDIMTRAQLALEQDKTPVYLCRNGEVTYRIPHREILYFFSERRLVSCVTAAKTYSFYGKLDDVAAELADADFVRIHQRYLVRAAAVGRVNGSEAEIAGQRLPISRACRSDALLALTHSMLK